MENNRQIRSNLWAALEELSDEQLNTRVEEGRWTIAQVLEHLYLIEKSLTRAMAKTLREGEVRPVETKPFFQTLDRSRLFPAPPYLVPAEGYYTKEELRGKLDASRQDLEQLLAGISDEVLAQKSFPHPVFGLMDLRQWLTFIGVHEQRHWGQIEELKQGLPAGA
ncbi:MULTISPECIES: DinB family protein [Paenibacillus]|uniref:DinB family protein n=1 Tax=Paenibacillus TaxID=44249 RepID=UPI0022B9212B|nr:DinB family protein [Paenibacillus caseinilyticus]MCZ8522244.1 DinB family protein [Paenibacillus caseinilyticus]